MSSAMTSARTVDEAEGFACRGLYVDAWEVLETIPPLLKLGPDFLRIRLIICAGLERWEMGQEIARVVNKSSPFRLREAAGRFHFAHARALCGAGDVVTGRAAVAALSAVWPEGRVLALDSPGLSPVL